MLIQKFHRAKQPYSELESVINNLNRILNTKKGFGFWRPNFGLGDYNEFRARKKIVKTLIAEIQENVTSFEPRVKIDDIKEVPSDSAFRLRFQVKGTFITDDRPIYIVVDALRSEVVFERG